MKKKKLTKKQALAVAASLDPNNKTIGEVAKAAGMSREHLSRISQNVTFQEALESEKKRLCDLLEKKGIGLPAAANLIKKGFEAKTTGQFGGDPDMKTRHTYLETFLKLKGVLSDGKEPPKQAGGNTFNFNFNDVRTEDLIRSIDEILAERARRKLAETQGAIPSV